VKALVAWRILAHEKPRSGLAIAGIFVAILLMFLQLGFYAYWTGGRDTDLSDQLSQCATLKAMGYENAYLVRVVLEQASFYALFGFLPAWVLGVVSTTSSGRSLCFRAT
jgi:ABC-type antimicrobial peptide transport system permease subunit